MNEDETEEMVAQHVTIAVQGFRLRKHLFEALDQPSGFATSLMVDTVLQVLHERIPIAMHKLDWGPDSGDGHSWQRGSCSECALIAEMFE